MVPALLPLMLPLCFLLGYFAAPGYSVSFLVDRSVFTVASFAPGLPPSLGS